MASAGPAANSVFIVTPQHGYPMAPGFMPQVPLYPSSQSQFHLIPGNPPVLTPVVSQQPAQRGLKEGKVLGAIQILVGLVHIGFGATLVTVLNHYYVPISFYGGFPFWGGICFIISGSLSVSAEKQPGFPCLLKGSVGMNIVCAIFSVVGIILYLVEISISNIRPSYPDYGSPYYWDVSPGLAISCVLLFFCLLEFAIACTSSHFGCQLVCYQHNNVAMILPNTYAADPVVIPNQVQNPK